MAHHHGALPASFPEMYLAPRLGARGRLSAPAAPVRPPFCRLAAALAPTRRMRPARPCHWQRAPRDRERSLGQHRCSGLSTRHMCQTYILATARPAQITAVWSSTPAPCCAPQGRGPGESWARGGRCARASPPDACARAAGGSRDGLCARAPTSLQRAGRPRPLVVMEGGALLGVTAGAMR